MSTAIVQCEALDIEHSDYSFREFFRDSERDGTVALLKAYFDDSADGKHEKFMAVGGLIGGDAQFTDMDILWSAATNGLEPFHTTDCETQHGQFENWTKADCDQLIKKLVGIIDGTRLSGFGSIVPVPEYRYVFPGAGEYDPYFLALKHTIINMAYTAALPHVPSRSSDIRIWHEDGSTSSKALRIYQELKSLTGWRWAKSLCGFTISDKGLMALQAADLIAREAYKHADNLGVRPTRKPVKQLYQRISFHLWTRDALEYLRDAGGPNNLEALTMWGQTEKKPPQMKRFYGSTFDMS